MRTLVGGIGAVLGIALATAVLFWTGNHAVSKTVLARLGVAGFFPLFIVILLALSLLQVYLRVRKQGLLVELVLGASSGFVAGSLALALGLLIQHGFKPFFHGVWEAPTTFLLLVVGLPFFPLVCWVYGLSASILAASAVRLHAHLAERSADTIG